MDEETKTVVRRFLDLAREDLQARKVMFLEKEKAPICSWCLKCYSKTSIINKEYYG
jgi:hypothetical protein